MPTRFAERSAARRWLEQVQSLSAPRHTARLLWPALDRTSAASRKRPRNAPKKGGKDTTRESRGQAPECARSNGAAAITTLRQRATSCNQSRSTGGSPRLVPPQERCALGALLWLQLSQRGPRASGRASAAPPISSGEQRPEEECTSPARPQRAGFFRANPSERQAFREPACWSLSTWANGCASSGARGRTCTVVARKRHGAAKNARSSGPTCGTSPTEGSWGGSVRVLARAWRTITGRIA